MAQSLLHAFGRISPPRSSSILQHQGYLRGFAWDHASTVAAMPTTEKPKLDTLFWPSNSFDSLPKKTSASAWCELAPHSADSFFTSSPRSGERTDYPAEYAPWSWDDSPLSASAFFRAGGDWEQQWQWPARTTDIGPICCLYRSTAK